MTGPPASWYATRRHQLASRPASMQITYDATRIDRGPMDVVTISPKFQVVIPRAVRERLKLSPGQKVQALVYDGRVELIPLRPARALRGFLRGIDTTVERDADRG